MHEIIEISDHDYSNIDNDSIKQNDNLKVITVPVENEASRHDEVSIQTISSTTNNREQTSIISTRNGNSVDLNLPFEQDTSTSCVVSSELDPRNTFSNAERTTKHILDTLIKDDSTVNENSVITSSGKKETRELKSIAEKWTSNGRNIMNHLAIVDNNTSNLSPDLDLKVVQSSEDVLEQFPMSSPIKQKNSTGDRHLREKAPADKCITNHSPTKNDIDINLTSILNDFPNVSSTPSRSKTIEDIPKFPSENVDVLDTGVSLRERTGIQVGMNELLSQYIVNSETYSVEHSKELVKEWLQKDRDSFKKANRIYRDSKEARGDIIVDFPKDLFLTFNEECPQLQELLAPATLQSSDNESVPLIRFFRRCNSAYDYQNDVYFPCRQRILEENVCLLYYDAFEFFTEYRLVKRDLYGRIKELRKRKNKNVILVLNNMSKLRKSIESLEDQRYKTRVAMELTGSLQSRPASKNIAMTEKLLMKNFDLEQRLRHIDRSWKVKIHVINSHSEFLSSLPNLVSLVGRQRHDPSIRFMKYAYLNPKSAQDKKDVLKKTLQQIARASELKADQIASIYPSFQSLLQDFSSGSIKTNNTGDHLMSESLERRVHKLFTCTNPNEGIE